MARAKESPAESIVILGGGIGGIAAANRLRRRLGDQHRITLINRYPEFSFAASYLWVMSGQRKASQITRPLAGLRRKGIELVIGSIDEIDPINRKVTVQGTEIVGDHLIVSLGADYATDAIPGLDQAGMTFATLKGAEGLASSIAGIHRGKLVILTAAPLYRCPAAPYEAALLIDAMLRRKGVRGNVDIELHAAEPAPLAVAGKNVSDAVKGILQQHSIDYYPSHQVASAETGRLSFTDGETKTFDLLAYMPPIKPPAVLSTSALAGPTGWIDVDPNTLLTHFPGVYAIGDNTNIPLKIAKPLPRAGVFAHSQALVVADNIASMIKGNIAASTFDGHGGCFLESDFRRASYASGNFYAQPSPKVNVKVPSRRSHLAKVVFEYNVMKRWL